MSAPRFAPDDGYYSFEALDGTYNGLVRITDMHFEYVGDHGWVNDQSLLRHFVSPDVGNPLERIDGAEARRLADRYGADLDAPRAALRLPGAALSPAASLSRFLPPQDPHDPDPSFASPKRPTALDR